MTTQHSAGYPMDAVLCYIDGDWAYFTTRPLADQWGDDWNDAPYEHNAGEPYRPLPLRSGDWQIVKVAWDADLQEPHYGHTNSPYSVEHINAHAVPWLKSSTWSSAPAVEVWAGATLATFIKTIHGVGGQVYLPAGIRRTQEAHDG